MSGILNGSNIEIARFVAPISVRSVRNVFRGDTVSLRTKAGQHGNSQRWEISTKLEPLVGDPSLLLHTVVMDSFEVFAVTMPQVFYRGTVVQSTLAASSSAGVGSTSINISGGPVAGEFIRFTNHKKVYLVTAVSGSAATLFPGLLAAVSSGQAIESGKNTKLWCRYGLDSIKGMSYEDGVLMDIGEIQLIEDI